MYDPYRSLYIHIPFCKKRCAYCDFATGAYSQDDPSIDDYVEELIQAIRRDAKDGKLSSLETVYFGGGTPSYIGSARLSKLLYALSVSMHLTPEVECTLEANPESLTEPMVKDLYALGVNRLSLGVQSLSDEVLKTLGRPHDSQTALHAIEIARTRFENVSVDMMCAVPGQTVDQFKEDLKKVIDAGVTHVSIYPLTIEEGTPLEMLATNGLLEEMDEDEQAVMMEASEHVLKNAGFTRYEVASYAYPGFESKHNTAYWTGKPYIGLGRSAVTMTQNDERRMRVQDDSVVEDLDPAQMRAEDLMLSMRMSRGVSEQEVHASEVLLPEVEHVFTGLIDDGLVEVFEGRYRPTQFGWLCGNELYGRIFDLAP